MFNPTELVVFLQPNLQEVTHGLGVKGVLDQRLCKWKWSQEMKPKGGDLGHTGPVGDLQALGSHVKRKQESPKGLMSFELEE